MKRIDSEKESRLSFNCFRESLGRELKYVYFIEKQLLKLLPRFEKQASTRYLKACFKGHYTATVEHVARLEQVFKIIGLKPLSKRNSDMAEFTEQFKTILKTTEKMTRFRDLSLIALGQAIEEFEIKIYNRLVGLANELGDFKLVFLLEETLIEEQEAIEVFAAVKEDTLNDELFMAKEEHENHSENTEEEENELVEVHLN